MSIEAASVHRIARLARIKVSKDEVKRFGAEISAILQWIEVLDEVDVSGVEPMSSVVQTDMAMRVDQVTSGGALEHVISNAPAREGEFFVVPKVVE